MKLRDFIKLAKAKQICRLMFRDPRTGCLYSIFDGYAEDLVKQLDTVAFSTKKYGDELFGNLEIWRFDTEILLGEAEWCNFSLNGGPKKFKFSDEDLKSNGLLHIYIKS